MSTSRLAEPQADWERLIPDSEWALYGRVLRRLREQRIAFALGGGFAFSYYAHRWRDTKDIDLYVLPRMREPMIALLDELGLRDYYELVPYDRNWIYRSHRDGLIVDVIWAMANQRAQADERWLTHGPLISLRGVEVHVVPVEELIWAKLYVMQRDRCDWGDVLTLFYTQGNTLDWEHLFNRLGEDRRLLSGALGIFSWMCPARAGQLPGWIWESVGLTPPEEDLDCTIERRRVELLDTRDWFGPRAPKIQDTRPAKSES